MLGQFGLPIVPIGPLQVNDLSADELAQYLINQRSAGTTQHVVTANAQYYVMAERQAEFRNCISKAEYVCADGVSVAMACRLLAGQKVPRIAGVDLVPLLCEKAASAGLSVYFLGGRPSAAAKTAALLAKRFPGLRVAGVLCPPYGFSRDRQCLADVVESIQLARPDIIYVALGVPFQDHFIDTYIRPLNVPIAVGVGGSFDIIGGALKRAPVWIQRCGFEWLFRWVQEPRRLWKRYLAGNLMFSFYLLRNLIWGQATSLDTEPVYTAVAVDDLDQETV